MKTRPIYVTGNMHKARYLEELIGVKLKHHKLDLDEIQTVDPSELIRHKAIQAYQKLLHPVLVEDVSFVYEIWGNLPGPFVKFFTNLEVGDEKMCRMLDGFSSRRAMASCTFGYYDGSRLRLFKGSIGGEVTNHPSGDNGFGFDRVFMPDGFGGKTAAELDPSEYRQYYRTIKPIDELQAFIEKDE